MGATVIDVKRKKNQGVASSYNNGIKKAKADYVVLMHSDSKLPTKNEVEKLKQQKLQFDN